MPDQPSQTYYARVEVGQVTAYKIGWTTTGDLNRRYNNRDRRRVTLLAMWHHPADTHARRHEDAILRKYRHFHYLGEPLLTDGNTELFDFDVLGLDPDG